MARKEDKMIRVVVSIVLCATIGIALLCGVRSAAPESARILAEQRCKEREARLRGRKSNIPCEGQRDENLDLMSIFAGMEVIISARMLFLIVFPRAANQRETEEYYRKALEGPIGAAFTLVIFFAARWKLDEAVVASILPWIVVTAVTFVVTLLAYDVPYLNRIVNPIRAFFSSKDEKNVLSSRIPASLRVSEGDEKHRFHNPTHVRVELVGQRLLYWRYLFSKIDLGPKEAREILLKVQQARVLTALALITSTVYFGLFVPELLRWYDLTLLPPWADTWLETKSARNTASTVALTLLNFLLFRFRHHLAPSPLLSLDQLDIILSPIQPSN